MVATSQSAGPSSSSQLLLKLFESDQFNVHLAVSYLRTQAHSIGVTYYLVNRLAQFPEEEVEFYWPQLCHLLITLPSESGALEGFVIKKCEESIHLAMLTLWQLQASLYDLSSNPNTPQFATCRRVYNRVQHIIFADPLIENSASAQLAKERISSHALHPAVAGISVLLAAVGLPQLAPFNGQIAIEQAKSSRRNSIAEGSGFWGGDASAQDQEGANSESEEEKPVMHASSARSGPSSTTAVNKRARSSMEAMTSQEATLSARSRTSSQLPASSSFRGARSAKSAGKRSTDPSVPSYLPGAPLPLQSEPFVHAPRTPLSASTSRRRPLLGYDSRKLGHAQSTSSLPSPSASHFSESESQSQSPNGYISHNRRENSSGSKPASPKVTFQPPSRSNSNGQPSAHSPPDTPLRNPAIDPSRLSLSVSDVHRNARSVPSLHQSASASSIQLSRSTSSLPSYAIPPETLTAMLRSYACRSQLDLITSLQDIATRLIVVPKKARISSLRAELTVLNHGLPRGCCLCLGCPGKGGGTSTASHKTSSFLSIFSSDPTTHKAAPHHRIVRISPSESVVLNSADRAPFLIHAEVLENDLDFDPARRQNAEDIRSIMTEREGSYKSRTTSVDRDLVKAAGADYSRNKSYDGPARRSNEGQTSPELTLSRSSSFKGAVDKAAFHGISECDGDLAFPRDGSHEAPNNQEEEVDMVEQLYGSMSVHDTQDISLPEYQPKIHNRAVDEAAWQRAEARRSLQLSSPPMLQSQNGAARPSHKRTHSRADKTARKPLTIDEYAERMRMAAIMLSQLNASQQLPRSGTDAVTGVVGAGVGLGVNLTYGVGSVVGSVVGVGVGAVRAGLGSIGTTTSLSALPDTNAAPSGQASSGVTAPIDPTTAASGLSSVAGTVNPAILPEDGTTPVYSAQQLSPANGNAVPNTIHQHPRQRVLSPPEAAAIRERIMSEMMSLEEERMARMRASSRSSKTSWSGSDKSAHPETTEEESVVMRAVNKEDPSGAVFAESWPEKKARIRAASPYGHLANWDVFSLIVKTGADLRQEQLAVQIIKEFGRIWSETKCPHWVRYFRILVTSESTGLMETITDAISVHSIKKEAYAKLAAGASAANGANNTGYLPSFTLYDHFLQAYGAPDSVKYRKGQDAFLKSLASYSIISYLLQIKDRHNGNILLDKQGHLMHIDFGFMLSNSPGAIGFEMAPFKLTQDYIDILGGMESSKFLEYRTLLKRQFRDVRQHAERIITMVELMQKDSKLPCFLSGEQTSQNLRDRFQLGLSASQADEYMDKLVMSSAGSAFTRLYDTFQRHSQGVL